MGTPMPNPSFTNQSPSQDPLIVSPPTQEKPDIQTKQPKSRISFWIILILIYGLVLYGFVGYRIYKKAAVTTNTSKEIDVQPELPQLVIDTSKTATSSYETLQYTLDILPVYQLEIFNPNEKKQLIYPSVYPIKISKDYISMLSRFQAEDITVIGPKNYKGGIDYIDEGKLIFLYPKNYQKSPDIIYQYGESFKLFIAAIGSKSALIHASRFFRWVRDNAKSLGIENELKQISKQDTYTVLTPHLILYTDFTSYKTEGWEIYGLAFCNAESHLEDKQWFSVFIEIAIAQEQRQLAKELLNLYIDLFDLKNK